MIFSSIITKVGKNSVNIATANKKLALSFGKKCVVVLLFL
jgi:hypothetical protein